VKPPFAIILECAHPAAFAGADQQIIIAIGIQVEPGHARPKATEAPRQKRLALEVVEWFVDVPMSQTLA
jgi:hypothetical protein